MRIATRPLHHRAVHELREAAERGDADRLAALLDPAVAVVVEGEDRGERAIRVVRGVQDAIALLLHGMAPKPGLVIDERSVNAQAGLMLTHSGRTLAAMTVDFTKGVISVVWIRLHPVQLRHWNAV
jgi:RNA polymerase sigma-70 factor (ECF subfamily)